MAAGLGALAKRVSDAGGVAQSAGATGGAADLTAGLHLAQATFEAAPSANANVLNFGNG